jgi:hypothetical protein
MKEILLCATAFSLTMAVQTSMHLDDTQTLDDFRKWQLMECESLFDSDYSIESETGRVKAAVECFFGGYYPLEPTSSL